MCIEVYLGFFCLGVQVMSSFMLRPALGNIVNALGLVLWQNWRPAIVCMFLLFRFFLKASA